MLPRVAIQEARSHTYLDAVCSRAGCLYRRSWPDYGLDGRICHLALFGGRPWDPGIEVAVQAKATTRAVAGQDGIRYDLDADQYRELTALEGLPRILVVYAMPDDEAARLEQSDEQLVLRQCAWWIFLRGAPPSPNSRAVRVLLPYTQRFDVAALQGPLRTLAIEGRLP